MATNLYRIRSTNRTQMGQSVLDDFRQFGDAFARLQQHRAAMVAQKGTDTDYAVSATTYGFVDAADAISATVAAEAFAEIDSLILNHAAAIQQACARFQQ
jgi:hypothetical protein